MLSWAERLILWNQYEMLKNINKQERPVSGQKLRNKSGNAIGGHHGFAHFLRRTLGRWAELKDCPDNSHSATSLPHYREMVRVWQRMGKKHELSEDEIEAIAEAR